METKTNREICNEIVRMARETCETFPETVVIERVYELPDAGEGQPNWSGTVVPISPKELSAEHACVLAERICELRKKWRLAS